MNKFLFAIGVFVLIFSSSSCRKIREDNLVKGLWQMQSIKLDTLTMINRSSPSVRALIDTANANGGDFLHAFLPGYTANKTNAYYRINYEKDDLIFSYYNIGDSNVYTVLGRWQLPKANQIYQKTDNFLDGFFTIKEKTLNEYEFSSDKNYIKFLNDTVNTVIKIKRV